MESVQNVDYQKFDYQNVDDTKRLLLQNVDDSKRRWLKTSTATKRLYSDTKNMKSNKKIT